MFKEINEELQELQQGIYRCQNIDTMLGSLKAQLLDQERKQIELELELKKQNLDVEKLSKVGVTSFFYSVLGSKEEQIEKERREVLAAQLKLDDINLQIEETKRQISNLQSERAIVRDSKQKYNELYEKKYEMLKQSKKKESIEITELENKIAAYKANLKEIEEAITAGNSVMTSLNSVEKSLNSAEGWGTWDMIGGGGLITNMIKHDHIDDARNAASEVQTKLNRFATELTDVNVSSSITIDVDGFVKFADFFFDGLISDWIVQSRIHDSQESVNNVRRDVSNVLDKLSKMQEYEKRQLFMLEDELSKIIMSS